METQTNMKKKYFIMVKLIKNIFIMIKCNWRCFFSPQSPILIIKLRFIENKSIINLEDSMNC